MRLYVDLSDQERNDMHGWVNYYREHPELIDTPPGVTRIVLEERSRARYEQIEAQFYPAQGFSPILRYEWDWSIPQLHTTIDTGDLGENGCVVIGFNVPDGARPSSVGTVSTAEYPGTAQRLSRTISLSQVECDFSAPFPACVTDQNPTIGFIVGASRLWTSLTPGRWYVNVRNHDAMPGGGPTSIRVGLTKPEGY